VKAVLDTNFLLIPSEFRTDIYELLKFEGFNELVVLSPVKRELELVGDRVSLQLLEKNKHALVEAEGSADDAIVEYAWKNKATVCTQDKTLKKRLSALKIPVLTLRGGKVLRSA